MTAWKKVYIFVSSTFSDMHAERDLVVKRVYPDLLEWCERRKLHLTVIDLRWGVSEVDALQNRNAIKVCLECIDTSRPLFICFLGQRRGYVPNDSDVSEETLSSFPGVTEHLGSLSITEIEIEHAIRRQLDQHRPQEKRFANVGTLWCDWLRKLPGSQWFLRSKSFPESRGIFYIRDPSYLADLKTESPELLSLYTHSGIADEAARHHADSMLERFRDKMLSETRILLRRYRARWNALAPSPELQLPMHVTSEIAADAWRNSWRQAGIELDDDAKSIPRHLLAAAEATNQSLTKGRLEQAEIVPTTDLGGNGPRNENASELADQIIVDLKEMIASEHPDHVPAVDNAYAQERAQHEAFAERLTFGYVERSGEFDKLNRWLKDCRDRRLMIVSGPAGSGKSSLLSEWSRRIQGDNSNNVRTIVRFVGVGDQSMTAAQLLRSILPDLDVEPRRSDDIEFDFASELAKDRGLKPLLIIIDGVDQLQDGLNNLSWLTQYCNQALPQGINLVASIRGDAPGADRALKVFESSSQIGIHHVPGFTDSNDRRRLVEERLRHRVKRLDDDAIEMLMSYPGAENPLFLSVVVDELCVYGSFPNLRSHLQTLYGKTPVDAFIGLLKRMEADTAFMTVKPSLVVPVVLGCLAVARRGLSASDLAGVILREAHRGESDWLSERQALDAVQLLRRQLQAYLSSRGGRIWLGYSALRDAIAKRYFEPNDNIEQARKLAQWHALLCRQWESIWKQNHNLAISELPFHLDQAGEQTKFISLLNNPRYLVARCQQHELPELLADLDKGVADVAVSETQSLLRKHFAGLNQYPNALTSLLQNFGPERMRESINRAVLQGDWNPPWVKVEPIAVPLQDPIPESAVPPLRMEAVLNIPLGESITAPCVAVNACRAFYSSRPSHLDQVDLETGRLDQPDFVVSNGRLMLLRCTPRGCRIAVIEGDGRGVIRTWELDETRSPLASRQLCEILVRMPQTERPCGEFLGNRFWHQRADGALVGLGFDDDVTKIEVLLTASLRAAELRWISEDANGLWAVVVTPDELTVLLISSQQVTSSFTLERREFVTAVLHEKTGVLLVTSDYVLRHISANDDGRLAVLSEIELAVLLTAVATSRGVLWGVTEDGRMLRFTSSDDRKTWAVREVATPFRLLRCRQVLIANDQTWTVVLADRIVHLRLATGDVDESPNILSLFAANAATRDCFIFRGSSSRIEYVDTISETVREVASGSRHGFIFAGNEHHQILGCRTAGGGFLFRTKYQGIQEIADLPEGIVAASSGPHDCFYVSDRVGAIWQFNCSDNRVQFVGSLPMRSVSKPILWRVGDRMLIGGNCIETRVESNDRDSYVDFLAELDAGLLRAGTLRVVKYRCFSMSLGRLQAVAVDPTLQRLAMFWSQPKQTGIVISLGTVDDFLAETEIVHNAREAPDTVRSACFTASGHSLVVCGPSGELCEIDASSGRVGAVLIGSHPYTAVFPTHGSESAVFVVEDECRVHYCQLVQSGITRFQDERTNDESSEPL